MPAMTKRKTERATEPMPEMPIPSYTIEQMNEFGKAAMTCVCNMGYMAQWIEPCRTPREFDAAIKRLVLAWEDFKTENGTAEYWQ
jgi:hypothetical protein